MPVKRMEPSARKDRFTRLVVILGLVALVALGIKYLVENRWDLLWQVIPSVVALGLFFTFGKKFNQDLASHFALTFTLVVHNLGLYSTHPLGIRFDHYTHFLGGFTVALVADRILTEKITRTKRFALILLAALGVGAVWEIIQWLDGYVIQGFDMFSSDDISNSMRDMICNGLGGTVMGIITLFRKQH
jgi:uncharacterized membrane protein YjdF